MAREKSGTLPTQCCTFRIAGALVGIDTAKVREVVRDTRMTPVRNDASAVRGLINLRGQIVPVIDLAPQLELESIAQSTVNVVIEEGDEVLSILADEIGDVVDLDGADLEPVPPSVSAALREILVGTLRTSAGRLLVLHVPRLLEQAA